VVQILNKEKKESKPKNESNGAILRKELVSDSIDLSSKPRTQPRALTDKTNDLFLSPKSALKTPNKAFSTSNNLATPERSVHFNHKVHVSVFSQEKDEDVAAAEEVNKHNKENVSNQLDGKSDSKRAKRPSNEATTPARQALAKPLAPSVKHTAYARGTLSPRSKSCKKVSMAIDMCLASSSQQREGCLEALAKVEASNRRPILLLKDNDSGGAPAFRGLYIQTGAEEGDGGDGGSELSRVFGHGPETFSLKDSTRCEFESISLRIHVVSLPIMCARSFYVLLLLFFFFFFYMIRFNHVHVNG
jgi:hypothetical protein